MLTHTTWDYVGSMSIYGEVTVYVCVSMSVCVCISVCVLSVIVRVLRESMCFYSYAQACRGGLERRLQIKACEGLGTRTGKSLGKRSCLQTVTWCPSESS